MNSDVKKRVNKFLQNKPFVSYLIRSILQKRKFILFCVGAPKTGTKSIANIFKKNYRSKHEPRYDQFAELTNKRWNHNFIKENLHNYFRRRDRELWLECESSHPIAWFSDILQEELPDSKFILTVRDCCSWLNSILNQHSKFTPNPQSEAYKLRQLFFSDESKHEFPELREASLFTIDGYLTYWSDHNDFVLNSVPKERLLVLPTQKISHNMDLVADFVNIEASSLDIKKSHSHQRKNSNDLINEVDPAILRNKINENCLSTIKKLKEFDSLNDYDIIGI